MDIAERWKRVRVCGHGRGSIRIRVLPYGRALSALELCIAGEKRIETGRTLTWANRAVNEPDALAKDAETLKL